VRVSVCVYVYVSVCVSAYVYVYVSVCECVLCARVRVCRLCRNMWLILLWRSLKALGTKVAPFPRATCGEWFYNVCFVCVCVCVCACVPYSLNKYLCG